MKQGKIQSIVLGVIIAFAFAACKKEAGEGGNSSIKGKVEEDLRVVLTNPATYQGTVYASDQDVFIVYGDHTSPDEKVQADYNGEFEFLNLREGNYTIYVFSKDTNAVEVPWDEDHMPVKLELEITDKKQDLEAGTMTIYDQE